MERKAAWVAGQLRELGVDTVFLMKPYYVIKALGDVPGSGFSEE